MPGSTGERWGGVGSLEYILGRMDHGSSLTSICNPSLQMLVLGRRKEDLLDKKYHVNDKEAPQVLSDIVN